MPERKAGGKSPQKAGQHAPKTGMKKASTRGLRGNKAVTPPRKGERLR